MNQLVYDEAEMIQSLSHLTTPMRTAFALLAATRIVPAYRRFHSQTGRGDPVALESLIERLWQDIDGDPIPDEELKRATDRALSLVPTEAEGWDEETQPYAEDAAAAVAYAFRARSTDSPQEAAWSARRVYESLDHYVTRITGMSPEEREDELAILSHPLIQAELARQRRDLNDLENSMTGSSRVSMAELRGRSKREAASLFETSQ